MKGAEDEKGVKPGKKGAKGLEVQRLVRWVQKAGDKV